MKKLLLTSLFKPVKTIFQKFVGNCKGKRLTFIPTACNCQFFKFYKRTTLNELKKLGFVIDILDIAKATYNTILTTLKKNELIYVSGGNTFYLLQEMKRTKTDILIKEEINNGKIYVGESAGAVILSPNISYIQGMDNRNKAKALQDYDALNVVPFYIVPHYKNLFFKDCTSEIQKKYQNNLDFIFIQNNEAVQIEDENITLMK